jgi:hypothetical protein
LAFYAIRSRRGQFDYWTSSIFAICVTLVVANFFFSEMMLVRNGLQTQSTVLKVDCMPGKKHHIYFRFSVDQTVYESMAAGSESGDCENISVGTVGVVTYMPGNPSIHIWGSTRRYFSESIAMLLFTLLMVGFLAFRDVYKRRREA